MRRQTDQQEIEEMKPVAWRPDGTPVKFEIMPRQESAPTVVDDVSHIMSPLPEARVVKAASIVEGSHTDRARAFNISTLNLSIVTGIAFAVAALVFGASVSFFVLSLYFFGGFALAWLAAYLLHTFVSAEGSQFMETVFLWQFLTREQKHRHGRYNVPPSPREQLFRTVLFAAAMGSTVLVFVALVALVFLEQMPK